MRRYVAFYFLFSILVVPVCLKLLSLGSQDTHTVQEGSSMEVICCSLYGPKLKIPDYNNELITTSDWNITYERIINRPRTVYGDTGWYKCNSNYWSIWIVHQPLQSSYIYVKSETNLLIAAGSYWIFSIHPGDTVKFPCRPTSQDYHVRLLEGQKEITIGGNLSFVPTAGFTWENLHITNNTVYTCNVKHNNITQEIHYEVNNIATRRFKEPYIDTDTIRHVTQGQNLTADCTVDVTNGSYKLQWIPPNNSSQFHVKTYEEPLEDGKRVFAKMIINNVRYEDAGKYVCEVSNADFKQSTTKHIEIHDPFKPHLKLAPRGGRTKFKSAIEGKIEWIVYVDAYPKPTFQWIEERNRDPIIASDKYHIENTARYTKLVINNVVRNDTGNYTLVAKNSNGIVALPMTLELSQPAITISTYESYYKIGSSVAISCFVTNSPNANVSWNFVHCPESTSLYICDEKDKIVEDITNASVTKRINAHEHKSVATFTLNTNGRVDCIGSNQYGAERDKKVLYVSDGDGSLFFIPPKSDIVEDIDFELTCGASIYKYTDKLKWLDRNDENVRENERLKISSSRTQLTYRSTLTIRNLTKKDENLFSCVTVYKNSEETINIRYNLNVLDCIKPYFIDTNINEPDIPVDLNNKKLDSVTLKCNIGGRPSPDVTWYKDDKIIEANGMFNFSSNNQELYIRVLEDTIGKYTCRGTNRAGNCTHSRRILLKGIASSPVLIAFVVVLVIICAILITIFFIKIHREKVIRKELIEAGLMHFEEGATECLNPDLTVDDQADLLPYDKKWEFPRERLKLGKQLGSGAFGVVLKADAVGIIEDESVTTVAVKMVRKSTDPTYIRALASELKIMVHLGKHLNVVNLLGACTKNIAKRELYVIVEYCRFGNLHNYLLRHRADFINQIDPATGMIDSSIGLDLLTRPTSVSSSNSCNLTSAGSRVGPVDYRHGIESQGVSMSPDGCVMSNNSSQPGWRSNYHGDYKDQNLKPICTKDLLSWAYQVAAGMEYLNRRRVLHGDLAARNILMAENNVIKICDFGLAKSLYRDDNYKKTLDGPLPIKWLAIESIRDRIFSTQSDVWSFGIVLWEFFTLAETPYAGMEAEKQYQKLIEGYRMEQPKYATKEVYEIMTQCWNVEPNLRPTFPDLLESVGNLLEEGVKMLYLDLNAPYMDMNTVSLDTGKRDYLTMMSAPDYAALSSADAHSVDSQEQLRSNDSTCLKMIPTTGTKDSGSFSPRPRDEKSQFPSVDKTDESADDLEITPMLPESSDYLVPINVQRGRIEFAKQHQIQNREEEKPESACTNAPHENLDQNIKELSMSLETDLTGSKNYGS